MGWNAPWTSTSGTCVGRSSPTRPGRGMCSRCRVSGTSSSPYPPRASGHSPSVLHSFRFRLLAALALAVVAAVATVAVTARHAITAEFQRYVERNREEMQQVAERVAADTGQRVVLANPDGRVIVDSSRELIGQVISAEELRERFGVSAGMGFVYSRPAPRAGGEAGPPPGLWGGSDGPGG